MMNARCCLDEIDITDYDNAVKKLARRFSSSLMDDLVQAGRLALLEASRTWSPRRGSLWTWARPHVLGEMLNMLKKELRLPSGPDSFPDASPNSLELDNWLDSLPEREEEAILGFLAGEGVRETADRTGSSKSSVQRALANALQNYRQTM